MQHRAGLGGHSQLGGGKGFNANGVNHRGGHFQNLTAQQQSLGAIGEQLQTLVRFLEVLAPLTGQAQGKQGKGTLRQGWGAGRRGGRLSY